MCLISYILYSSVLFDSSHQNRNGGHNKENRTGQSAKHICADGCLPILFSFLVSAFPIEYRLFFCGQAFQNVVSFTCTNFPVCHANSSHSDSVIIASRTSVQAVIYAYFSLYSSNHSCSTSSMR